jgi:lysophospholipase L1-like esterase
VVHIGPQHIKFKQQTNMHSLFFVSITNQAVARNSSIIASGSNVTGPRPTEPLAFNNVSPLMARLFAELAHVAAGIRREAAAEIVVRLNDTFKDKLDPEQAAKGQALEELYDLQTPRPSAEHQPLYDKLEEELTGRGVPL